MRRALLCAVRVATAGTRWDIVGLGRLVLHENAGFNRIEHVSERHQFSEPMALYGGGAMLCHPESVSQSVRKPPI